MPPSGYLYISRWIEYLNSTSIACIHVPSYAYTSVLFVLSSVFIYFSNSVTEQIEHYFRLMQNASKHPRAISAVLSPAAISYLGDLKQYSLAFMGYKMQ